MAEKNILTIYGELCFSAVFRGVLDKPLFKAFESYCLAKDGFDKRKAYAAFVAEIYALGGSLTENVSRLIEEDENVYVKTVAAGETPDVNVRAAAQKELSVFARFGALSRADFALDLCVAETELPDFSSFNADMGASYQKRLQNLDKYGYGIFSSRCMFRLSDEKQIEPIVSADKTVGYGVIFEPQEEIGDDEFFAIVEALRCEQQPFDNLMEDEDGLVHLEGEVDVEDFTAELLKAILETLNKEDGAISKLKAHSYVWEE